MKVVDKQTMKQLDKHMIEQMNIPSLLLMENAAFGISSLVAEKFGLDSPIVVICGAGNNGGDGFAVARQLMAKGYGVSVYLIGKFESLKGDAKTNAGFFGESIIEVKDASQIQIDKCSVVIDAIFGIGLSREVTGLYAEVIQKVNDSNAYIIACDISSGIDSDTGKVLGTAVEANETVTFACAKQGHLLYPGREYTGVLTVKEIGVSGDFDIGDSEVFIGADKLDRRDADSHKGCFGKLACIVGSKGMAGAGIMCAKGALKGGAGLTTIGVPESIQSIYGMAVPECLSFALEDEKGALSYKCVPDLDELMKNKTALAAGCGLSICSGTKKAIDYLVKNFDIKKVFDADALNLIAQDKRILKERAGEIVLTPHLGEFERLAGKKVENPLEQVREFAKEYGVVLLLKGATTIVTDGRRTSFILAGTPGMAKGGSGDVLTGVIGGLLAGGMECFDAAGYGAYICGVAGEKAAQKQGEYSMTALDTLNEIGAVMKEMIM